MTAQHMQKGHAKLRKGEKVHLTKAIPERKVQINKNTWIYTSKDLSDEQIIEEFNRKYKL